MTKTMKMGAAFAILNVLMYISIHKFWIGGSSFLPLIGKLGDNNKFLFALIVNIGVIVGAFIAAKFSGEFILRYPHKSKLFRTIIGGILIGIGISIAPGTCTTAVVVGLPMLSVSSILSIAGIMIGGYIVHSMNRKSCRLTRR
jgi:uncharacterized membrane protein YedE/YeeE